MSGVERDRGTAVERRVAAEPPAARSVGGLTSTPATRPTALPGRPEASEIKAPAFTESAARAPSIPMLAPELPAVPPVDTAVAPAPPIPAAEKVVEAVDKAAIDRLLDTYQQSYTALDAALVSTIWRGLDTRGLQRAFDALDSQRMSFEHCDVIIADDKARASCTGVLDYVRKYGNAHPLQKRLSWNFDLQRTDDDRWLISKVDAR